MTQTIGNIDNAILAVLIVEELNNRENTLSSEHYRLHEDCSYWNNACNYGDAPEVCANSQDFESSTIGTYVMDFFMDNTHGFSFLGRGISRTVLLGPDGVAYKVGAHYANEAEATQYARLSQQYTDFLIAPCSPWTVEDGMMVLAMQAYANSGYGFVKNMISSDPALHDKFRCVRNSLPDMHYGNVAITDDLSELVVIDYGAC